MNKLKFAKQAQRLYEIENLNAQEIADRIGVSRRTVFNWITRFNWKKHKINMAEIERTFPIELQEMVSKMISKVTNDIDNNRKVSSEELYTIANIAQHLDKIEKQNQRKQRFVSPDFEQQDTLSDETISQLRKEFLGLDD